jgi:hypothetical protein
MKVDFTELDRRTPVAGHAMTMALAGALEGFKRREDGMLEVVFTVNGIEGDFEKVLKRFEEHFEEAVEKRAAELLNERHWDGFDALKGAIEEARRCLYAKTKELFPKSHLYDQDGDE